MTGVQVIEARTARARVKCAIRVVMCRKRRAATAEFLALMQIPTGDPCISPPGRTIEDEQCQRIGGGYKAANSGFLLFLRTEPRSIYAGPGSGP